MTVDLPKLGRFEQIELRSIWDSEAGSFTPWLADKENTDLLAATLGLPPLEILSTELPVGPFRADIVCRIVDSEELVLIENQIERSDHTHLGQILTYAAGLKAAHIVWITSRFTDEHRAALDWLNEITGENFNFFAVEIEAWRIGDSLPAPRFNVVAKPNNWTKAVLSTARRAAPEGIDVNRVAYWGAFSELLSQHGLPLKVKSEPPRQGFYSFTLDRPRQIYLYAFRNVDQRRIGVYLAFYGPMSRATFESLSAEKEAIERQMSEELVWLEDEPHKKYHIMLNRYEADALDERDWPNQHRWLLEKLAKYLEVFGPRLTLAEIEGSRGNEAAAVS